MRLALFSMLALACVAPSALAQDAPLAPPSARPLPPVAVPAEAPAEAAASRAETQEGAPVPSGPAVPASPIEAPLPTSAIPPPSVAPVQGAASNVLPEHRVVHPVQLAPPSAQPLPGARLSRRPPYEVPPRRMVVEPRRHGDARAPLALSIGPTVKWRSDRGYDRLTLRGEQTAGVELAATYDVLQPAPRVVIAAGLSYRHLDEEDPGLRLSEHELEADLVARVRALGWLSPHVRAGGGLVQTRVTLHDQAGDFSLADSDLGWLATAGAGATVHTPARLFETRRGRLASLSFGLLAEGGYAFAQAAALRVVRAEQAGVPRAAVDLGTLTRAAPYLRLAVVVRF